MILYYYYSDGCSCCKGYDKVVERVAATYGLEVEHVDLSDITEFDEPLEGVPCVIIMDGGDMVYKSVGNLREEYLSREIERVVNDANANEGSPED